jgi:glycosyltransferase involved in cell wall biosynthesis
VRETISWYTSSGMRFSILLPTKDRLEYLKLAVQSVLRQDFLDWELVISDNFSHEDIGDYVASLADPRIVSKRTERPVAVTENWNRALAHSHGDYVLMLGDDDALLPGYLRRMDELIGSFDAPDLIYSKSFLFAYPTAHPVHPAGFLMDRGCAKFFQGASGAFVLDPSVALDVVRGMMSFRLTYDFNAQFALISRTLIESLRSHGDFYQSEFPDFYSMNAVFLRARRIVIDPSPGVLTGLTPKSYGYFHYNHLESEARSFLDPAAALQDRAGTNMNVGWLSAATVLEKGAGAEFGLRADHRRYRIVQAADLYPRYIAGEADPSELRSFERELPTLERLICRAARGVFGLARRVLPRRLNPRIARVATRWGGQMPGWWAPTTFIEGRYRNVLEVYEAYESGNLDPSHQ